jgi:Ankyrin repeat
MSNSNMAGLATSARLSPWAARSLLVTAFQNEDFPAFATILTTQPDVNGIKMGTYGTLVHEAAGNRDSRWLRLLLEHGAASNYRVGIYRVPPTTISIEQNIPENVELLLSHGADPNAIVGDYPFLTNAWNSGKGRIVKLLLNHGANINAPTYQLKTFVSSFRDVRFDENRRYVFKGMRADSSTMEDYEAIDEIKGLFKEKGIDLKNAKWENPPSAIGNWTVPGFEKTSEIRINGERKRVTD